MNVLTIPVGTPLFRYRTLSSAINEYNQGVHEVPPGSDRGDGVDKYGKPGTPWCMAFCLWNMRQAGLDVPMNWSSQGFWKWASDRGMTYSRTSTDPRARVPGNIAITKRDKAHGHAMLVLAFTEDGQNYITVEGNTNNPNGNVDSKMRPLSNKRLLGFINPYPGEEQPGSSKWGAIALSLAALFAYMSMKKGGIFSTKGGRDR